MRTAITLVLCALPMLAQQSIEKVISNGVKPPEVQPIQDATRDAQERNARIRLLQQQAEMQRIQIEQQRLRLEKQKAAAASDQASTAPTSPSTPRLLSLEMFAFSFKEIAGPKTFETMGLSKLSPDELAHLDLFMSMFLAQFRKELLTEMAVPPPKP
jgi:hypothetical protein